MTALLAKAWAWLKPHLLTQLANHRRRAFANEETMLRHKLEQHEIEDDGFRSGMAEINERRQAFNLRLQRIARGEQADR